MLESKLRKRRYPLLDVVIRRIRVYFWLCLPYLFGWLPLLFRFALLAFCEVIYNFYLFFVKPPHIESLILARLAHENSYKGVAIVTGGTSGIGKEVARSLVLAGYHVHLPARSLQKAEAVASELQTLGKGQVTIHRCDVGNTRELKEFIKSFRSSNSKLDILINGAGNYSPKFQLTEDGMESHMATHVLGTFALTNSLAPLLAASSIARVVIISSAAHYAVSKFDVQTLNDKRLFSRLGGYSNAKFAQTLLGKQLALDLKPVNITVNIVHPGMVDTSIVREDWLSALTIKAMRTLLPFALLNPQQGALTIVWAALSQEATSATGRFFYDLAEDPISWVVQRDFTNGKGVALVSYLKGIFQTEL
jgi:NAD(P)-dependent dehydrogenase (short-subunit alcohol dehydrogenase family)